MVGWLRVEDHALQIVAIIIEKNIKFKLNVLNNKLTNNLLYLE